MSKLEEALKMAEDSGQSEAKLLAEFVWDLEEREPDIILACMDEFIDWAGSIKDAVREDNDLPTQGEMWAGRREP